MSKIDFYLIPSPSENERFTFACRLIEKAYKKQHRIYIHTENKEAAHHLDELLWTHREESFLPHDLYGEGSEPIPPIQIGYHIAPEKHRDILINLSSTVPEFYKQFSRILELIARDATAQAAGRERYKLYRAEGHEIITHQLQAPTEA
ncbi:MAG: holC [Gammaproteobacteria bacterium]|jgi:DNA polymerase-3 subunit chi|nr:holC [Gammaproteobacteria bacterium]